MFFVNSMSDLFHENVPDEVIDRIFAIMALCPQHTFQVLTKRAARMREYMSSPGDRVDKWFRAMSDDMLLAAGAINPTQEYISALVAAQNLPNVWFGVSVEDQTRADERIRDLLATPAAIRFISAEPLLGPMDLNRSAMLRPVVETYPGQPVLDWVIVGGESGKGARPMHPDWATSIRDQCRSAGVPFFFKQWGDWGIALDRDYDDPDFRLDYTNDYGDHGKSKWLNLEGGRGFHGERFHVMRNVGTKRAGRRLEGVQHNAMPERR
jgi:protein gp37